jgi:hypothetical protein
MAAFSMKEVKIYMENNGLDMNKRVTVRNTSNIENHFRFVERTADAVVAPKGKIVMPTSEILAQIDSGNVLFCGYNRDGKHASLFVEDREVRVFVGFESDDGKQKQEIIDEQAIVSIFDANNLKNFYSQLQDKVVTMGEKQTLKDVLASDKVDSHEKIKIAEAYLRGETVDVSKKKAGRLSKTATE